MKLKLQITAAVLSLSLGVSAQNGKIAIKSKSVQIQKETAPSFPNRGCATAIPSQQWDAFFNSKVEEYKKSLSNGKTQAVNVTIPVIVHVIHGGQAVGTFPNLPQAQINSQIQVLNADYAGVGYNYTNTPAPFLPAKANTGIQFCLATKNPTGGVLPEPGIERIDYNTITAALGSFPSKNPAATNYNSPTTFQNFIDGYIKPNTIWNPTLYMNIWVTDEQAAVGLLGYATFPVLTGTTLPGNSGSGTATNDGLWCYGKAIGSNVIYPAGTYDPTYNKGRTATHEIGHWLGLRHIWGDGGQCGATDYCNDTPPQKGTAGPPAGCYYGCPTFPSQANTCTLGGISNPNGDMFMNFMDYTDDPCMYMFTNDQSARMLTTMTYGTYRSLLGTSANTLCTVAAATPTAAFTMTNSACTTSAVIANNQSVGTPAPTYVWSSNPSAGVTFNPSNTANSPSINFTTAGNYSITVAVTNSVGTSSTTKTIAVTTCTTATVSVSCNDTLTNVLTTGTLNLSTAGSDTSTPGCSPKAGYVFGSNCYQDAEKAEFFAYSTYSALATPQIKGAIVIFYKFGTRGTGGTASTQVNLKLYNGTMAGGPTGTTSPIATMTANLGGISGAPGTTSVNYCGQSGIVYTNPILRPYTYSLTTPVNLPNSNGFFASLKVPTTAGDTAVVMDDQSVAVGSNWELWSDNSWHNLSTAWGGLDASMAILPIIQCGTVTAINPHSVLESNINLYPNPTNGIVNAFVTFPNSQNLDITITNTLGQVISITKHTSVTSNVFALDLNSYGNGVYFVTFSNGQEKVVKRVILNK